MWASDIAARGNCGKTQMDKAEGETLRAKLMEARTLLDDLMAERNEMEAAQVVANGTHPFLKYSDS